MAKEKIDNEAYVCSAQQLFDTRKHRDIITNNLSVDIGLGGGVPLGCTMLLGGKAKSGKTTLALQYAASAQAAFGSKVFFANIEGRLDNKILSQIKGLDLSNVEVIMGPAILDKDKNIIGNRKMPSQQWWQKIGTVITNNPRSVIIVDSISSLSDEAELADGMGHFSRGGLQKLEAQFRRQYGDLIVPNQITLILLAQIQSNTSGWGETIIMKCGNALKHLADIIMFIKNTEKWKPNADGRILGHDIHCRIDASSLGPPFVDTTVGLRYGYGLDNPKSVIENSISWDIIKADGAWFVLPFDKESFAFEEITEDKLEEKKLVKLQGEENARRWLIDHPESMLFLDNKIRQKIFI